MPIFSPEKSILPIKMHKFFNFLQIFLIWVLKKPNSSVIIGGEMKIISNNKNAYHDFFVSDLVEAGVVLEGCEVKSVRAGGININDAYVAIKNGEAILKNCYIAPYDKASTSIDTRRNRKLLLHKVEIQKLERKILEKGFSVVPIKVYLSNGLVKLEIALAKGKKLYDKRASLKDKAVKREIERALKSY